MLGLILTATGVQLFIVVSTKSSYKMAGTKRSSTGMMHPDSGWIQHIHTNNIKQFHLSQTLRKPPEWITWINIRRGSRQRHMIVRTNTTFQVSRYQVLFAWARPSTEHPRRPVCRPLDIWRQKRRQSIRPSQNNERLLRIWRIQPQKMGFKQERSCWEDRVRSLEKGTAEREWTSL